MVMSALSALITPCAECLHLYSQIQIDNARVDRVAIFGEKGITYKPLIWSHITNLPQSQILCDRMRKYVQDLAFMTAGSKRSNSPSSMP